MRLAANVLIFLNRFLVHVEGAETDNDAMHRRLTFRFVAPLESAMGEVDVHALAQQPAPQHADLFALADAVGGDEGAAGTSPLPRPLSPGPSPVSPERAASLPLAAGTLLAGAGRGEVM